MAAINARQYKTADLIISHLRGSRFLIPSPAECGFAQQTGEEIKAALS